MYLLHLLSVPDAYVLSVTNLKCSNTNRKSTAPLPQPARLLKEVASVGTEAAVGGARVELN